MGRPAFVRQRILEAAFDLFARKGFEAVTTRQVAEAAAVGPTSMYRHFATMEELGRAVYATAIPPLAAMVTEALGSDADAVATVRALVTGLYRAYDERPRALALLVFPPHDFDPAELAPGAVASPRSLLDRQIADPDLAAIIWGAIIGPIQDRFLHRRTGLMAPLATHHADLVVRLLPDQADRP